MAKTRDRTLKELYNVTCMILEPEITPVLRGSCRMQGPVDETYYDNWTNTVSFGAANKCNWHSMSRTVRARGESGTCNVCCAPCSSCMHFNRADMGLNSDESSDETCRVNATSQFSANEVKGLPSFKKRACDSLQHTVSETSNPLSVNSSYGSFSEIAESKAEIRFSEVSEASEDVEILPKLSTDGKVADSQLLPSPLCVSDHRTCSNKYEDSKSVEGHDDNISCISGVNDASKLVGSCNRNLDRQNISCSSVSIGCLGSEGFGKAVQCQTASGGLDIACDVKYSCQNCGKQTGHAEESIQEVPPISLTTENIFQKSNSLEIPLSLSKDRDDGTRSQNVPGSCCQCGSGKSPPYFPSSKNLEGHRIPHLQEKLPDCSLNSVDLSLMNGAASDSVIGQKSAANNRADIHHSERKVVEASSEMKTYPKLELKTDDNSVDLPYKSSKCSDEHEEIDKFNESFELPDLLEPPLQSASGDETDDSDIVEHDVKVCDICGDAGREDLLAICSRCSDGAEHTYCMREMLDKVPEGDWLCEECKFADEAENQKQGKLEVLDRNEKVQYSERPSTVHADLFVNVKDSDVEISRVNKVTSGSQVSSKRNSDNLEVGSAAIRQALETAIGSPKASSPSRAPVISRESSFKSLDKGKVKPAQPAHQTPFGANTTNDVLEAARASSTGSRLQTPRGTLLKSNSFSTANFPLKVKPVDEAVPQKQKWLREPASLDLKEGPARMISKSMSFKSVSLGRSNTNEAKVKMLSPKVQDLKGGLKKGKERSNLDRKGSFNLDHSLVNSTTSSSTVSTPKFDQKLPSRGEGILSGNRDLKSVLPDGKSTCSSRSTSHLTRKGSEISVAPVGALSTNGTCSSAEQKLNQVSLKDEPSSSSSLTTERPSNIVSGVLQDGMSRSLTNQCEKTRENSGGRSRQITTGAKTVSCQRGKESGHAPTGNPRASAIDVTAARSPRELANKDNKLKAAIEAAMLKRPGIYKRSRLADQSDELSVSSTDLNCEMASQDQVPVSSYVRNMICGEGVHEGQAVTGKQPSVKSSEAEFSSKRGDLDSNALSDGKFSTRDYMFHASDLKMCAIPELEYIWQGGFEVHRGGKPPEFCGGVQAHLSICASPKVLEMASKFPLKVSLSEVPRLSTWPTHFRESGAKDDNIALYFFAKDLESYERNYKFLLESMMKNDLALKGNFDDVELLIFPSNLLHEKSQCWNMLFFLWGVFRGRRVRCSEHTSSSLEKLHMPSLNSMPQNVDTSAAVMSMSENTTLGHIVTDSSAHERSCSIPLGLPYKAEQQDYKLDLHSISRATTSIAVFSPEIACTSTSLKEPSDPECKVDSKLRPSAQVTSAVCSSEDKIKDSRKGEVKFERHFKDERLMDSEAALERGTLDRPPENKGLDNLQLRRKHALLDSVDMVSQSSETSLAIPWNQDVNVVLVGGGCASKKQRTNEMYACNTSMNRSSSVDGFASQLHVPSVGYCSKEKQDGACDETMKPGGSGTGERYFFPMDLHNVKDFQLGDKSTPWKVQPLADEDRLLDGPPDLELALGAEKKPPKQGILPFFVGIVDEKNNQDKPSDVITTKEEEDDVSASLSLSLAFPFSDKERTVKPVSKTEQLMPERHHVNTSLLLFGGFPDS